MSVKGSGLIHELVAKGVKIDDGGANICAGKMAATQAEGEAEIAALRVRVTDLDVALQKSQEEVADLKNIELYAQSAIRETEAERDTLRARVRELEVELKGANLAAEKLDKAYDAARAQRDAAYAGKMATLGGLPMENWSVHPEPITKAYVDENSLQTPDAEKGEK